jgi:hypothetical protein
MKVEIHIKKHLMIPIGIIEFLHLDEVGIMVGCLVVGHDLQTAGGF